MANLWILILVGLSATNSLEKVESVKLEETPLKTFDEIFGEGWWDKGEAEDLKTPAPTNFGQNVHRQIDRQNTQIGQIEPNSFDQNPPITESDHSENAKNGEVITSNENITEDERRRKIIDKFHAMKDVFKQKEKFSAKEWSQIDEKIAKHLKVSRSKIYEWKKEFGLSRKVCTEKEERKHLIEKFDSMKAELKRGGFKNSYHELDETVAKELGINFTTISRWKSELGQIITNYSDDEKLEIVKNFMQIQSDNSGNDKKSYKEINKEIAERFGVNVGTIKQWKKFFGLSRRLKHSEQKELMKRYYEIKDQNSKIIDKDIAKMLNIGRCTLYKWKKQFIRPNLVDGHSVEENGAPNVQ